MNIKSKSKVKRDHAWISLSEAANDALEAAAEAAEMPYFVHRSWRRYMGRGTPAGSRGRTHSYMEACTVIFNEWSGEPADVARWAHELNWPVSEVEAFIEELKADGVFDMPHPILGVRS